MKLGLARPRPSVFALLSGLALGCGGANPSSLFDSVAPPAAGTTNTPPETPAPPPSDAGASNAHPTADDASTVPPTAAPPDAAPPLAPEDATTPIVINQDASTATPACPLAGEPPFVIDDGSWQSDNAEILPQCGRTGSWYSFNDGVSTQQPSPAGAFGPFLTSNPPPGAHGYVRSWGTLSETASSTPSESHWGAGIAFDVNDDGTTTGSYNATAGGYHGLSFWILAAPGSQSGSVTFFVPTNETAAYADGAYHCYTFTVAPTGVWTKIIVPFTSLAQPSWALPNERVPFNASAIATLQWNFAPAARQALAFDVSIGDVELW